jgi:hypothetical protein
LVDAGPLPPLPWSRPVFQGGLQHPPDAPAIPRPAHNGKTHLAAISSWQETNSRHPEVESMNVTFSTFRACAAAEKLNEPPTTKCWSMMISLLCALRMWASIQTGKPALAVKVTPE